MAEVDSRLQPTRWRSIAALWCAGAVFDASQTVLIVHAEGRHYNGLPLFGTEFVSWLPWALATPIIIRLARRYPMLRGATARTVGVHATAFAAVSAATETWSTLLQMLFNPFHNRKWPTFVDTWTTTLTFQILTFLIAYALILTITYVVDTREGMARQMTETARLNEELSKAQLAALRRQMEPHFMFNTLNSIAGLVRDRRNEAAVSMIVGLSEFLRRATEDSHRSQVTLAEEVEYLQRYLEIQKVRFGERLQVSVDISDELRPAQVPNLLLQPLVENAIKHGIAKRIAGGSVRIGGARQDGTLRLTVCNDGPNETDDGHSVHSGVGLGNLRTRLHILYGDQSALQLNRPAPNAVEVVVTLPWREA
jgi:two-component system, LytTR family, sensor kinase